MRTRIGRIDRRLDDLALFPSISRGVSCREASTTSSSTSHSLTPDPSRYPSTPLSLVPRPLFPFPPGPHPRLFSLSPARQVRSVLPHSSPTYPELTPLIHSFKPPFSPSPSPSRASPDPNTPRNHVDRPNGASLPRRHPPRPLPQRHGDGTTPLCLPHPFPFPLPFRFLPNLPNLRHRRLGRWSPFLSNRRRPPNRRGHALASCWGWKRAARKRPSEQQSEYGRKGRPGGL